MEGVQGKGREDVGEENWQGLHSGTALPLVVQMLREGSANSGPCGSRWTETSQGGERGSGKWSSSVRHRAVLAAGQMWQARQLAWQAHPSFTK